MEVITKRMSTTQNLTQATTKTKATTIVADRELVLIIELKDENNETNYEA